MANNLIPKYLDIDYNTIIQSIKDELATNITFRDYNYEGSNIAILIELVAYIGELYTYYLNKVAKNVYIETADVYENVNILAHQEGYEVKGYTSSKVTLSLTVSGDGINDGDILYVYPWHELDTGISTDDGDDIKFSTTSSRSIEVSSVGGVVYGSDRIPVVQGTVKYFTYDGSDIIANEIILPTFNYAHDDDVDDTINTVELKVNGLTWTRVSDFYDELSALELADNPDYYDNVYMVIYDKYRRTKVVFNSSRNVPISTDTITINMLVSLGIDGNIGAITNTSADGAWTPDTHWIKNLTTDEWVASSLMTIETSAASTGGTDPEEIEDIREQTKAIHNSQYRDVTATDYKAHLEQHSEIGGAYVWGEKDVSPSGNVLEYNKVHITVVPVDTPDEWNTGTLNTSVAVWVPTGNAASASASIYVPTTFVDSWTDKLESYLEPRMMLSAYEEWEVPELVYFKFDIGVRLYRLYSIDDIDNNILDKLEYYFRQSNRKFYDLINFMDISEYLLDQTEISPTNNFDYIKGIRNLNIRDVDCSATIYEPNNIGNYPQYTTDAYVSDVENQLRSIRLGRNQFPIYSKTLTTVTEE